MLRHGGLAKITRLTRVGIAADHGGVHLKTELSASLRNARYEVEDFGAYRFDGADDYPDFIIPVARAGLKHDVFSVHQSVEDDDINVLCLGGKVIGSGLALELIETFLHACFSAAARHERRLPKVHALETGILEP